MSPESDINEADETPVLQYARLKGLSRDHLAEQFPWRHIAALQARVPDQLTSDSELPQLDLQSLTADLPTKERLFLTKEGAQLLVATTIAEKDEDVLTPLLQSRRAKRMKLELPLLRTDHEQDCRQFAKTEGFEPRLGGIRLPEETVDDDKGEGFTIPSQYWDLGDSFMDNVREEKLIVSKETLTYIKGIYRDEWTDVDQEALSLSLEYKRNPARVTLTPPLLPMPQSTMNWEPNSSELEIPLLSDPASDTQEQLDTMEKDIFKQDLPTPIRNKKSGPSSSAYDCCSASNTEQKIWNMSSIPSDLQTSRRPMEDLKVEGPLTPIYQPVSLKAVRFSEHIDLLTISPDPPFDILEESFFEEAFGEAKARANRLSEQEKLALQDSKARIPVPLIGFPHPEPPWKRIQSHRNKPGLENLQRQVFADVVDGRAQPFTGLLKLHNKLPWVFQNDTKSLVEETSCFEDDSIWKGYVFGDEADIVNGSSLTWKPPGLMILRNSESDDGIEPGIFEIDKEDLTALIRKRKCEFRAKDGSEAVMDSSHQARLDYSNAIALPTGTEVTTKHRINLEQPNFFAGQDFLFGTNFSAADAISNFQTLRGTKKLKPADSSFFPSPKDAAATLPPRPIAPMPVSILPLNVTDTQAQQIDWPFPGLDPPCTSVTVIATSEFMQRRSLVRHIQESFPSLTFLERDLKKHNTSSWLPGSVSRSPIISSLAKEADLIVSPSTGIVLTTLSKVKQKLLPGQKGRPAFREHIDLVSQRYERLIIVISADNGANGNDLSNSDALAVSEFLGFTAGLACQITTKYIPGFEVVIAKWITHSIIQHCISSGESTLLEDETSWELFLRRAGMNVYAAQAIIFAAKAPEGVNEKSPTKIGFFGLTALVEMSYEERVHRFGAVLGGTKLLKRLDELVNTVWK